MRMCGGIFLFALSTALVAQQPAVKIIGLAEEPHHQLLLENASTRVYRLALRPGGATQPHHHNSFYIFVSVGVSDVSIEVKGRPPVVSHLEDGELRTSKGGFTIAERNTGATPLNMIVIEPLNGVGQDKFEDPMASFHLHDTFVGNIFEEPRIRAYDMAMASGGRTEQHTDKYGRLIVALTDLFLSDNVEGKGTSEIRQKRGDVAWFPGGASHMLTNLDAQPAHFVTVEFR